MQKYALYIFDILFVESRNEFVAHLAINLTVKKKTCESNNFRVLLSYEI